MAIDVVPQWMTGLEEEEVTYPTVRLRLDRLIQKIQMNEDTAEDPFVSLVKRLALKDKMDLDTAKVLIAAYKKEKGEK